MTPVSLLSALTDKMRWHQQRQDLLSQNVANADTPGYKGRDLKTPDFGAELGGMSLAPVATEATDPMHFAVAAGDDDPLGSEQQASFEVTPEGNGVTLEDEMMKVTANQMDYEAVTSLYTKSLQLLRTAIGH